jgi:hypothetical protein
MAARREHTARCADLLPDVAGIEEGIEEGEPDEPLVRQGSRRGSSPTTHHRASGGHLTTEETQWSSVRTPNRVAASPTGAYNCTEGTTTAAGTWSDTPGPTAASSRSSAAPPRSRKKSSHVALAYSLTRSSTKSVLPDSDTMLDERLELALLRKSMSGSAGPCSPELLSCAHRAVKAGSTSIGVGGRQHGE